MWKGIKALTNCKTNNQLPADDATLPDILNQFFAHFDVPREEAAPFVKPSDGESFLVLRHYQVRADLKKVNASKATGPDGVLGRILKVCADQLAEVFTKIFNLSNRLLYQHVSNPPPLFQCIKNLL